MRRIKITETIVLGFTALALALTGKACVNESGSPVEVVKDAKKESPLQIEDSDDLATSAPVDDIADADADAAAEDVSGSEPKAAYPTPPASARAAAVEKEGYAGAPAPFEEFDMASQQPVGNTARYRNIDEQGFKEAKSSPLSTFSIDVDTAGYSMVRRFLNEGQIPPAGAVRIEEMLNYFTYSYEGPKDSTPFAIHTKVAEAPWDKSHRLVRVGIKGKEIARKEAPIANLVFLIDVSGSMDEPYKLPLLKESLKLLVRELRPQDTIGIAVYAGNSGVALEPTSNHAKILRVLDHLEAGGSTNGASGIEAAYKLAAENFTKDGINRVILATDGDFNVGTTSESDLIKMIEKKAESGVFLSVLGFGSDNYNDSMMEQLADRGNGNYAYIDSLREGKKVLVDQMSGTLVTIAKDVKIQVEFNPALVASYHLIGYENRALANEDFNDDKKDAGEIGAGHTVTALYEVVPIGAAMSNSPSVDALRYQKRVASAVSDTELLTVKVRYKLPDGDKSLLISQQVEDSKVSIDTTDKDFKFAAAVAGFGMKLRNSKFAPSISYSQLITLAKSGSQESDELRDEFVSLMHKAKGLDAHH